MIQQTNHRFTNWAKNESCVASGYFQPGNENDLIDIIKKSKKVRVVGTGHSWSSICLNEDALINLDHYNKVLHLDKDKLQLKVQAGVKLNQLNEYLDKQRLALSNLGSICQQSLAGAVSTGTHGSGINYQILGSQVEEFSLIKADGEKITLHWKHDKDLFNRCLINLGCIGVVSEITLNIVPAFNLHDQTFVMKFDEALDKLDEMIHATDHFKMWWFPHSEHVVVYRYQRTQQPVNDSKFRQWFMDEFVSVNMYRLLLKIGNMKRDWRKRINPVLVEKFIRPLDRIEKSYEVFNVPEPPLHRETEWAFDISLAKDLLQEYKAMINASQHRVNFIQEIRFTKADEYALSPCYGRSTIWLGAYNADNFGWKELLSDFEAMAKKYNGRPHWGKEFAIDKRYLKSVYPELEKFNSLRQQFDPKEKFSNNFISQIFS
ncbi:MAG: D-arabinono-1,4-lactone oxidase [Bacteroidota bacterium]